MRHRSNLPADALSDLLDFLQVRCELSGRLVAGGTWARRFANLDAIKFCAATAGRCWYFMDGMERPAELASGDVLVTNGTRALILASSPARIARAKTSTLTQDDEGRYLLGSAADLNFTMLGGSVQVDARQQGLLLNCLPPLIHVQGTAGEAASLSWLLAQLVAEMAPADQPGRPGRTAVVSGLAQLLFVQTLRAYLAQAPQGDQGWLKGLGDPGLAGALGNMHREPARDWNVDALAKEAGMSRTSFAVRFREMMGVPPLAYLTRWRMLLASRELRAGASIAEAAARVGYASESAFSSTFKRFMDLAPGQYRRSDRAAGTEPGDSDTRAAADF